MVLGGLFGRLMRENNLLSPHRCRRRQSHDRSFMPRHVGHRWRSGVHGGRRLGLDLHRREHWNAECVGWHVCKSAPLLQPISMGLAGLYGSTAAGAARGLALRMDSRLPVSVVSVKFWRHPAVLRLRRRAPDHGVLKEQIIHGRDGRRWSSSGRRDLNQARRVRQTCVQGTGCATIACFCLVLFLFPSRSSCSNCSSHLSGLSGNCLEVIYASILASVSAVNLKGNRLPDLGRDFASL